MIDVEDSTRNTDLSEVREAIRDFKAFKLDSKLQ